MQEARKQRLSRLVFILNGLLFVMGGVDLLDGGKTIFGILQLIAGLFNLVMVIRIKNQKFKNTFEYLILIMNVVVASSVAFDYFMMGKKFIQYVWVLAAIMSLIALVIQIKKRKLNKD